MSAPQGEGTALQRTPAPETRPKAGQCTSCSAPVLHARTTGGLDVIVGADPLTAVGELAAVLAGRSTYTWHRVADHLGHRYPLAITGRPAGSPRQTVHAAHTCGDQWPALESAAAITLPTTDAPPY